VGVRLSYYMQTSHTVSLDILSSSNSIGPNIIYLYLGPAEFPLTEGVLAEEQIQKAALPYPEETISMRELILMQT
jgi:hypothetical protein